MGTWHYKGYEIYKVYKHFYYYYKIEGEKQLYSYLKDAKAEIDRKERQGGDGNEKRLGKS